MVSLLEPSPLCHEDWCKLPSSLLKSSGQCRLVICADSGWCRTGRPTANPNSWFPQHRDGEEGVQGTAAGGIRKEWGVEKVSRPRSVPINAWTADCQLRQAV